MDEELKRDIIDGKIIDWSKLSKKELEDMKAKFEKKEKDLLEKIDKELTNDDQR